MLLPAEAHLLQWGAGSCGRGVARPGGGRVVEIEAVYRAVPDRQPARPGRKLAAARRRSILFAASGRLLLAFAAAIAFALDDGDVGVVGETIEETDDAGGVGKHDVPVFEGAVGSAG